MKRKPYPTFEQCIAMGRKQQKAEPHSHIMKRFNEIPQTKFCGINIERLQISNLMEEVARLDFKSFNFGSFAGTSLREH